MEYNQFDVPNRRYILSLFQTYTFLILLFVFTVSFLIYSRNVQYQLLELMSMFDDDLLPRAGSFNMNPIVHTHILTVNMKFVYRKIIMFVNSYTY